MLITQEMIDKAIKTGSALDCARILKHEWDSLSTQEVEDLTLRLVYITLREVSNA